MWLKVVGKLNLWTDRPELVFSSNAVFIRPENIINKEDFVEQGKWTFITVNLRIVGLLSLLREVQL